MNDQDDPMVKDLVRRFGLPETLAVRIMIYIRSNLKKYFQITNSQ